jgi:copper transporter 1
VFRQWRIGGAGTLLLSMAAVAALGVLYEGTRVYAAGADRRVAARLLAAGKGKARSGRSTPEAEAAEDVGLLRGGRGIKAGCVAARALWTERLTDVQGHAAPARRADLPRDAVRRAGLPLVLPHARVHDVQRAHPLLPHGACADGAAQAYLILAVVAGAALGHFVFSPTMDVEAVLAGGAAGKGMSCH